MTETGQLRQPEYELRPDGTAVLLRWPRADHSETIVVPESVQGHRVTGIAPLAFAPYHLPAGRMAQLYEEAVISFSAFCMKQGRELRYEADDAGGPREILLPAGIGEIGEYAFWHCGRLERIRIPGRVRRLGAGVFGKCQRLREVILEEGLREIGYRPTGTKEVMPETGTFYNCNKLERLCIPDSVSYLGAELFNSSGLRILSVRDGGQDMCRHAVQVHPGAFHHTARLQWMERVGPDGQIRFRIGLPLEKEKILRCDPEFGRLGRVPELFFSAEPAEFDRLAQEAFRLDFSGRMAVARLGYPLDLRDGDARWYLELLVEYADRIAYFGTEEIRDEEDLLGLICQSSCLTGEHLMRLLCTVGENGNQELALKILRVRRERFPEDTGFEGLEL